MTLNKFTLLKTLALLTIAILTFSCSNDNPTPSNTGNSGTLAGGGGGGIGGGGNTTPSASAVILGRSVSFSTLRATLSSGSSSIELETSVGEIVAFIIEEPVVEKSYEVFDYNKGYYVQEGGVNIFETQQSSFGGTLNISEVNLSNNYISGTFSFEACMGGGVDCITVESGKFNRVPIQ